MHHSNNGNNNIDSTYSAVSHLHQYICTNSIFIMQSPLLEIRTITNTMPLVCFCASDAIGLYVWRKHTSNQQY